eukprot:scaffold6708_cov134-Cylindrotheca_fusiformis.AAC.4
MTCLESSTADAPKRTERVESSSFCTLASSSPNAGSIVKWLEAKAHWKQTMASQEYRYDAA